jgi:hypothetical protein
MERCITAYDWRYAIVRYLRLWYREGYYLCAASVALIFLTWLTLRWPYRWVAALLAGYYVADSILVNTWITFINRDPIRRLRSVVLTLTNVSNVGLAFATINASLAYGCFDKPMTVVSATLASLR